MTPKERADAFLADLAELTAKHGIIIDSCGDCQSMWVCDTKDEKNRGYAVEVYVEVSFDDGTKTYGGKLTRYGDRS